MCRWLAVLLLVLTPSLNAQEAVDNTIEVTTMQMAHYHAISSDSEGIGGYWESPIHSGQLEPPEGRR